MAKDNPLGGLSVPSLDELVDDALASFGIATIDLGDPKQRRKLHAALCNSLGHVLRWRLFDPMQKACSMALGHTFRLMEDPDYQEKRTARRRDAAARRKQRAAERSASSETEREFQRQKRAGLVQ